MTKTTLSFEASENSVITKNDHKNVPGKVLQSNVYQIPRVILFCLLGETIQKPHTMSM